MTDTNHAATPKDPAIILHEAILICGDCPECGSDNWTDALERGECHSCGAKFSPTIPRQMRMASAALDALTREVEDAKASEARAWEQRKHDDDADTACRNLLSEELDETRVTITAQAERIAKLEEVLLNAAASLAAAISLLERGSKKAAPSDKMFDMMLSDYQKALAGARATLAPKEA